MMLLIILCVTVAGVRAGGGAIFTQEPDGSGKVGFMPPDLSDDNAHSSFLPDRLRCSGCQAVAYQLFRSFRAMDRKRPSLRGHFPESLIYKVTDEVCDGEKAFEKYGLRLINDIQELFGPGLDVKDDAPGVKEEGGRWPARLRDMCTEFIDKLGDNELFRRYKLHNDVTSYTNYLCYNTGVRGVCQGQKKYKLPEKLANEDVYKFSHDESRPSRPATDVDVRDNEDIGDYYADDYEEDYDEEYYDDDGDEKLSRKKRRAKRENKYKKHHDKV